jgi:hypothetical protein
MSLILRIWNSFYHSVAEPQPKISTLTTEATEEHGGNQNQKMLAQNDLKSSQHEKTFIDSSTEATEEHEGNPNQKPTALRCAQGRLRRQRKQRSAEHSLVLVKNYNFAFACVNRSSTCVSLFPDIGECWTGS